MKRKISIALSMALILSLVIVGIVLAGATTEFGQLAGYPPIGEVNWFAWRTADEPPGGGPPSKILTEENTNASEGFGLGYLDLYEDGRPPYWWLQVENFQTYGHLDEIQMIFGGLGASSGKVWKYDFIWDQITDSVTWHEPEVPLSTTMDDACPVYRGYYLDGNSNVGQFYGEPNTLYYIYRNQQGSGAEPPNGYSSGRYLYLMTATTDDEGYGTFTDSSFDPQFLPCYYTVIKAGDSENPLAGCHSDKNVPTAATVSSFDAVYDNEIASVAVSWETVQENLITGFKIYRAESLSGGTTLIESVSPDYLPGNQGGSYVIYDSTIVVGKPYYYWLSVSGTDQLIGPVFVMTGRLLYLPLMFH